MRRNVVSCKKPMFHVKVLRGMLRRARATIRRNIQVNESNYARPAGGHSLAVLVRCS